MTIPPRKKPAGKRIAAQIKEKETDGRRVKRSNVRAVKPAAMFTTARSVPWAWAKVNMSRRVSFPTLTYHPILKPCSISRTAPSDKKTRSDHQPKRKLRSANCASGCACFDGRFILREKLVSRPARSAIFGKHPAGRGRPNRWPFLVDRPHSHCALRAAIFRKRPSPLHAALDRARYRQTKSRRTRAVFGAISTHRNALRRKSRSTCR